MDRQAALDGIQQVVRDVLGDDDIVITEAMAADEVDGWDSIAHVNIIIGVEQHFGLQLKAADLARLRSPGAKLDALVDLVMAHG
jgi:acyl carrier protein